MASGRRGPAATRPPTSTAIWEVLKAFASFGFCKAHAAAFALPTYHSAWLKTHHPAAFLAGVLTHDPGMYPKRLILDDARSLGIAVLGLDVNASDGHLPDRAARRSRDEPPPDGSLGPAGPARLRRRTPTCPTAGDYGIRLSLADVKGISDAEVAADRGRPALRHPGRLLAPGPRQPAGGRAAGDGRRLRLPLRPRRAAGPDQRDRARPARAGHPA